MTGVYRVVHAASQPLPKRTRDAIVPGIARCCDDVIDRYDRVLTGPARPVLPLPANSSRLRRTSRCRRPILSEPRFEGGGCGGGSIAIPIATHVRGNISSWCR